MHDLTALLKALRASGFKPQKGDSQIDLVLPLIFICFQRCFFSQAQRGRLNDFPQGICFGFDSLISHTSSVNNSHSFSAIHCGFSLPPFTTLHHHSTNSARSQHLSLRSSQPSPLPLVLSTPRSPLPLVLTALLTVLSSAPSFSLRLVLLYPLVLSAPLCAPCSPPSLARGSKKSVLGD